MTISTMLVSILIMTCLFLKISHLKYLATQQSLSKTRRVVQQIHNTKRHCVKSRFSGKKMSVDKYDVDILFQTPETPRGRFILSGETRSSVSFVYYS